MFSFFDFSIISKVYFCLFCLGSLSWMIVWGFSLIKSLKQRPTRLETYGLVVASSSGFGLILDNNFPEFIILNFLAVIMVSCLILEIINQSFKLHDYRNQLDSLS